MDYAITSVISATDRCQKVHLFTQACLLLLLVAGSELFYLQKQTRWRHQISPEL